MSEPTRFRLEGHAGPRDVLRLQQMIAEALRGGADEVVLDLAGLTRLSAPSMSLLCGALRGLRLAQRHAQLRVLQAPPLVAQILTLCEIDGLRVDPAGVPAAPHPVDHRSRLARQAATYA